MKTLITAKEFRFSAALLLMFGLALLVTSCSKDDVPTQSVNPKTYVLVHGACQSRIMLMSIGLLQVQQKMMQSA